MVVISSLLSSFYSSAAFAKELNDLTEQGNYDGYEAEAEDLTEDGIVDENGLKDMLKAKGINYEDLRAEYESFEKAVGSLMAVEISDFDADRSELDDVAKEALKTYIETLKVLCESLGYGSPSTR